MPKNPHANFTPSLDGYTGQGAFRFWCQMALPLTYDDSLSYYELLNKVVKYLNNTISDVSAVEENVGKLNDAYVQLQDYVNNYFDELDIEAELRNVLDAMALDGTLDELLDPLVADRLPGVVEEQIDNVVAEQIDDSVGEQIGGVVSEQLPPLVEENVPENVTSWLNENVDPVGSAVIVDNTLSIAGAAADAKTTGDKIAKIFNNLTDLFDDIGLNEVTGWSNFEDRQFINLSSTTVTIEEGQIVPSITSSASSKARYIQLSAMAGDKFVVSTTGGGTSRAYGFISSTGNILDKAITNAVLNNQVITAPNQTAFLVVNDIVGDGIVYSGDKADARLDALESAMANTVQFRAVLTSENDLNDVKSTGIYRCAANNLPANRPTIGSSLLVTYTAGSGSGLTIIQCYYTAISSYFRYYVGNTWYDWLRIYISTDELMNNKSVLGSSDDCNDTTATGFYRITSPSFPANLPENVSGTLIVYHTSNTVTQCYYTVNGTYFRFYSSSTWNAWNKIYTLNDGDLLNFKRTLNISDDLNNITALGIYRYSGTSVPSNAPVNAGGIVMVYNAGTMFTQIYYGSVDCYFRFNAGSWGSWIKFDTTADGVPLRFVRVLANRVNDTPAEDLNDIKNIGLYRINTASDTSVMPNNIPSKSAGAVAVFNLSGRVVQLYFTPSNTYFRFSTTGSAWSEWIRFRNSNDSVMEYIGVLSKQTTETHPEPDLIDNVTNTGIYRCTSPNVPTDAPENTTGILMVYSASAIVGQTYYSLSGNIYNRIRSGGNWSVWKKSDIDDISSLPVLELTGDTSNMSKTNEVTLNYNIFNLTGSLSCKWQGSSSLRYPKKNYTLKFDNGFDAWNKWCGWVNSFRANNGIASRVNVPNPSRWSSQKKYCMKANWIDPSMARNIVCARLWGQIVKSRVDANEISDGRADSPNYGAIDGFPIEIKINGKSQGLYTFNIPKDKWMLAMGGSDYHYIVGGENNGNASCCWKESMGVSNWNAVNEYNEHSQYAVGAYTYYDDTLYKCNTAIGGGGEPWNDAHWTSYFAIEHVEDNVPYSNPLSSLDQAIQLIVNAGNGWDSNEAILAKLDVDSVFDYFIFACCLNCHDGLARNILYGSYDGNKWFMTAYDLDTTFGSDAYSTEWFNVVNDRNQFAEAASMNRLAYLMLNKSPSKLKTRYRELRESILSNENVWHELSQFIIDIPSRDYNIDRNIWPVMPGTDTATLAQYMEYYRMHCNYLDREIEEL